MIAAIRVAATPAISAQTSTRNVPSAAGLPGADEVGDPPGEARAEREQEGVHPVGRVAALASSWFA